MTMKSNLKSSTPLGAPASGMFGSDRWGERIRYAPENGDGGGGGGEGDSAVTNDAVEGGDGDAVAATGGGEGDAGGNNDQEQLQVTEGDSGDWRASIGDEKLRKHAERFTSAEEMAKAHMDLRNRLSKAVNPPGEDASDEEVTAFREKMGIPETPEGYEPPEIEGYETTDGDAEFQAHMAPVFHKWNIPAEGFKEIAEAYGGYVMKTGTDAKEAQEKADNAFLAEAEQALRKEWGKDFDANVRFSADGSRVFFDEDIGQIELKGGQLLGSHPVFMKGMAQIGRMHGEGIIHVEPGSDAAASLREQADKYRAKREEAHAAGRAAEAQKYDKLERETLAKMGGNAPVVGAGGRTA